MVSMITHRVSMGLTLKLKGHRGICHGSSTIEASPGSFAQSLDVSTETPFRLRDRPTFKVSEPI